MNNEYVYERALLMLVETAARLGVDIDVAAIAPTRRQSGNNVLVPADEYQAVVQRIFTDPRETLGIELARALPIESSGLWGFLLRSSPTFGDLLQRAQRYIRIVFRYTRLRLEENHSTVALVCEHPRPSPFGRHEQEVCFFLGQWLTWGRSLVGDHIATREVQMQWEGLKDKTPIESFFGCPVHFNADKDALVIPRNVFELPLPERSPELTEMFDAYAAALIRSITPQTTFTDQVREAMAEGVLSDTTSEAAVAQRLRVTVRTLRRRLAESQSSFRQLRSEFLRSRAEQLLQEQQLPIAEVSYLLGYAEPSNFHRAFRRWTGLAPAEWRKRRLIQA